MAVIVLGLTFALAWAIWHFFHAQLTEVLRWIRVGEMWIATLLVGHDYAVMVPNAGKQSMNVWRDWLPKARVSEIGVPEIIVITYVAVLPLRSIFAGMLGLMMLWAIFYGPGTKYRRRMTLEDLIKEQARSFPAIAPFIKFNPLNMPYRVPGDPVPGTLPMFSEALSPEEWIAFHEIKVQNNQLDMNKAYQALALQLGKRWQGPLKLSMPAQGLYAAFALRHARKRKESEDLLNQLSLAWSPEKGLDLPLKLKAQIRQIIKNPKLGGALQKYTDKHAFETTALLRALSRSREEGGVLAPASFLWLRGQDRTLWYPLNNLGRKSYHPEAVGALVHYTNELIAGQKIPTPRFEDVIKGIEAFLRGPGSRAIPPLDKKSRGMKR
jgi:intracellular multiplication protein IcmP